MLFWEISGGEGGIRTPGRGISPYNGLANRRLQPLGHLSGGAFNNLPHARQFCCWPIAGLWKSSAARPLIGSPFVSQQKTGSPKQGSLGLPASMETDALTAPG